MTLPVYVINLDRRPDRLAGISENLERIGIAWQRISAIDAESLTDDDTGPWMDEGSAACSRSHCKALETLLASSHPAAMILEDDTEVASDTPAFLDSVEWWPAGHGLLKLDTPEDRFHLPMVGPRRGGAPTGRELREIVYWGVGGMGYLIDRAAARIVLDSPERETTAIDVLLFHLRESGTARRLRPLWVVPSLVRESGEDFASDIAAHRRRQKRQRGRRAHLMRQVRNLPLKIKLTRLRLAGRVHRQVVPYRDRSP